MIKLKFEFAYCSFKTSVKYEISFYSEMLSYLILDISNTCMYLVQVYNLLVPSPEEDGAPYESLHVIAGAYPEGIASFSFCDGNVLVTGSKDHQVCVCVCVCVCACVCARVHVCVHV